MTLYTSGDWKVDPNKDITFPLVDWIVKLFPVIKDKEIEINQVDLDGLQIKNNSDLFLDL